MINSSSSRRKRQTELEGMRYQEEGLPTTSFIAPSRSASALTGGGAAIPSTHYRSPVTGGRAEVVVSGGGRTASTSVMNASSSFPRNSDRAAVYLNRQLFTPPPLRQPFSHNSNRPMEGGNNASSTSYHPHNNGGSSATRRPPSDASRFLFSASADGRSRNYGNVHHHSSADRLRRVQPTTISNNKENVTPRYHAPTLRQVIQPGDLAHSGLTPRKRVIDVAPHQPSEYLTTSPTTTATSPLPPLPSYVEPRFVQWTFPTWAVKEESEYGSNKKAVPAIANGRRCCVFCEAGEGPTAETTANVSPPTLEDDLLLRQQRIQDGITSNKQKDSRKGGAANQKVVVVQNDKKMNSTNTTTTTSDAAGMGEVVSLIRLASCNHYCCRKCAVANSRVVWRSGATEQLQEIVAALTQQQTTSVTAAPLTSQFSSFASPTSVRSFTANSPSAASHNNSGIRSSPSARNLMQRAGVENSPSHVSASTPKNGSGMHLHLAERLPSYHSGGGGSVVRSGSSRYRLSAANTSNFGTPFRGVASNHQHELEGSFKSPQQQSSAVGTLILSPEHHGPVTPSSTNAVAAVSLSAIKLSLLDESHTAALTPRTKVSIANRNQHETTMPSPQHHLRVNGTTNFTSTFLHSNATRGLSDQAAANNTSDNYKPLLKLLSKSVLRDADHAQMLPILEQFTALTRSSSTTTSGYGSTTPSAPVLTKDEAAMLLMKLVKRTEVRCSQCSCCDEFISTLSTTNTNTGSSKKYIKVNPSYLVDPEGSITAHIPPPEDVFQAACHIVSAVQPPPSSQSGTSPRTTMPMKTMELVPHNSTLCDSSSIKMHLLESKAWRGNNNTNHNNNNGYVINSSTTSSSHQRISLPPLCSHSILDRSEGGAAYVALLVAQHHHQLKEEEAAAAIFDPTTSNIPERTTTVSCNALNNNDGAIMATTDVAEVSNVAVSTSVNSDVDIDDEDDEDNSPPHVSQSRDHSPDATSLNVSVIEADDLAVDNDDDDVKKMDLVDMNAVEEGSRDRRSNTMPPGSPVHSPIRNHLPRAIDTPSDDNTDRMATSTIPHLPLHNFNSPIFSHNGPTDTISPRRSNTQPDSTSTAVAHHQQQCSSSPTTARTSTSNRNGVTMSSTPRLLTPMRMPRTARTMYQSPHVPDCTPMSGRRCHGEKEGAATGTAAVDDDDEPTSTIPHQLLAAFTTHRTPLSMWNSNTVLPKPSTTTATTADDYEGEQEDTKPTTIINDLDVDGLDHKADEGDQEGAVETVEVGSPYHVSHFSDSGFFPGSPSVIGTEGDNANDEDRSDAGSPLTKTVRSVVTGAAEAVVEDINQDEEEGMVSATAAASAGPAPPILSADNDNDAVSISVEITPPEPHTEAFQQEAEDAFPASSTPPRTSSTVEVAELLLAVEVVSTTTSLNVSYQHIEDTTSNNNNDTSSVIDNEEDSSYQLSRVVSALKKPSTTNNNNTILKKTVSFSGVARREVSIEGSMDVDEPTQPTIPAYEPRRFWDDADAEETNERLQHYRDMLHHTVTEAMERAVMRAHISSTVDESRLRRTASAPESMLRHVDSSLHDIDDELLPATSSSISGAATSTPLELQPLDQTHTQRALRRLLAEKRAEEARRVAEAAARGRRLREDPRSLRMHVFDAYNRTHARGCLMPATAEVVPAGHTAQYSIVELNYIDEDEDEDSEIEALDRDDINNN